MVADAWRQFDALGERLREEQGEKLMERVQHGVDGDPERVDYDRPYPWPYPRRPGLGARLLVRSHVKRFLSPLVHELADWHAPMEVRERAGQLLGTCIVFMEEHSTADVDAIVPTLVRLVGASSDPSLSALDRGRADAISTRLTLLVGRFIDLDATLPLLLPLLPGDAASLAVDIVKAGGSRFQAPSASAADSATSNHFALTASALSGAPSEACGIARVLRCVALLVVAAKPARIKAMWTHLAPALADRELAALVLRTRSDDDEEKDCLSTVTDWAAVPALPEDHTVSTHEFAPWVVSDAGHLSWSYFGLSDVDPPLVRLSRTDTDSERLRVRWLLSIASLLSGSLSLAGDAFARTGRLSDPHARPLFGTILSLRGQLPPRSTLSTLATRVLLSLSQALRLTSDLCDPATCVPPCVQAAVAELGRSLFLGALGDLPSAEQWRPIHPAVALVRELGSLAPRAVWRQWLLDATLPLIDVLAERRTCIAARDALVPLLTECPEAFTPAVREEVASRILPSDDEEDDAWDTLRGLVN
jgi:hypothetical protein